LAVVAGMKKPNDHAEATKKSNVKTKKGIKLQTNRSPCRLVMNGRGLIQHGRQS